MVRASGIVRKARKALQNSDLLKILRSEISQEISANRFSDDSNVSGTIGQFAIQHDSRDSMDVLLRRKSDFGEEVVVSALLGTEVFTNPDVESDKDMLPKEAMMKVCVKKLGMSSILQFNCGKVDGSEMYLNDVFLLPSTAVASYEKLYRGPSYEMLDEELQNELMEFLKTRGVDEGFTDWLLFYLHRKEQGQYVDWLQKIETFVAPDVQE